MAHDESISCSAKNSRSGSSETSFFSIHASYDSPDDSGTRFRRFCSTSILLRYLLTISRETGGASPSSVAGAVSAWAVSACCAAAKEVNCACPRACVIVAFVVLDTSCVDGTACKTP